jgi:hypothetical protein
MRLLADYLENQDEVWEEGESPIHFAEVAANGSEPVEGRRRMTVRMTG